MDVTNPARGDYRGEGEATEVWNGSAWLRIPFARESTAHYYGYTKNIEAMKADGRWDAYLAWAAKGLYE